MIKVFLWKKVSWTCQNQPSDKVFLQWLRYSYGGRFLEPVLTHTNTHRQHTRRPHTRTHTNWVNWIVCEWFWGDWWYTRIGLCVLMYSCLDANKQTNKPIIFCKIVPACEPFLTSAASFWTPQRGRLIPFACLYVNFVLHILNFFGCRNASVGNMFCNKRFFPIKPILENLHSGLLFRPGAIACILNRAQCRVLISSTRGLRDRWLSREEGTDSLSRLYLPPTLCPRVEGSL